MNDRAVYANADARDLPLADESVHMIATSSPYWGLRSYDTGANKAAELGAEPLHDCLAWARGEPPCGACFVCNLRTWAREMHRVLRDDGVMFLNLGDTYASSGGILSAPTNTRNKAAGGKHRRSNKPLPGLKPKDMVGIPWRVALALQADGWYLRSDVIWNKRNPLPENVTDRPSKVHEYIFLLSKSPRYFWDAEAVKEPASSRVGRSPACFGGEKGRADDQGSRNGKGQWGRIYNYDEAVANGRNLRSVWNVSTSSYRGAHYAVWPPALVETMVRAGTSERGVCPVCGSPWKRVVEKGEAVNRPDNPNDVLRYEAGSGHKNGSGPTTLHKMRTSVTTGWRPTCAPGCPGHETPPVPAIVLDPFCGSGTTLMVARQLGRIGLGFDLSEKYLRENAAERLGHDRLAAWEQARPRRGGGHEGLPLFAVGKGAD